MLSWMRWSGQSGLLARMLIGFIHGVMNTDNTSIAGETIDYGPCASMDAYDPATVFSSIDHAGRYAYGNQPGIAQWNLALFAETLLPFLAEDEDQAVAAAKESRSVCSRLLPGEPISAACGARSASPLSARTIPRWHRTCWRAWRGTALTSP